MNSKTFSWLFFQFLLLFLHRGNCSHPKLSKFEGGSSDEEGHTRTINTIRSTRETSLFSGISASASLGENQNAGIKASRRHLSSQLELTTQISSNSSLYYFSNEELEAYLKNFIKRCGHISHLYSIGTSAGGFPLWVLEISDKPNEEEEEPAFKFTGNMHGDEPLGRHLVLYLAEYLCGAYGQDPQVTLIVDNMHLHLLPSMNPDGFARKRRNNNNNVDLNRDFPDQWDQKMNSEDERQPEVKAVMAWTRAKYFIAGASLHEGAVVANYPWDGSLSKRTEYSQCPDDSTYRYMAETYSRAHFSMWNSTQFRNGVTNGAAWYPLYGGMQDWNYIHGGCMELTLELNDDKWPSPEKLPLLWEHNRPAMLALLSLVVKSGIHGKVLSAADGKPLPASVDVEGIDHQIKARLRFGDFYRLLPPGTYKVTVSYKGHKPSTTEALVLLSLPTGLDFLLEPLEHLSDVNSRNAKLRGGGFAVSVIQGMSNTLEEEESKVHEVELRKNPLELESRGLVTDQMFEDKEIDLQREGGGNRSNLITWAGLFGGKSTEEGHHERLESSEARGVVGQEQSDILIPEIKKSPSLSREFSSSSLLSSLPIIIFGGLGLWVTYLLILKRRKRRRRAM